MLTEKQHKRFYFPAWNRAFAACWRCDKGRILPHPDRILHVLPADPGQTPIDYYEAVMALAKDRAAKHHRAPTTDDLRHACHQYAIGKDKSSWDLTNPELNRVVTLFGLLAEPNNKTLQDQYVNPPKIDRKTHLWYLNNRCQHPYVVKISQDEYGTPDYHTLTDENLHNLVRTLKNRPHAWIRIPQPQPISPDDDNCPY